MNPAEYRLNGRLESGALADLFLATRDDEEVVIKLFQEPSSDHAYARRIAETARALAAVQHPGIVHEVDVGVVQRRLAIVRPSVPGFTLGAALQRLNTREVVLPSAIALAWIIELLEAVQTAHEAGVVHGGITPGNVMVTFDGQLRICDFGSIAALLATPALKKSLLGSGRGGYRAPEVHRGEAPSEVADVYSVSALLYELLTLREPGGDKDVGATRVASVPTRRDLPTPPSRIDRRLNGRIDPIVMRALDPVPTRRFRSAAELASALRNFLAESGGVPSPDEVRRCVGELSVPPAVTSELPFEAPFSLTPIDGGELGFADERSLVAERPAYSGGKVKPDEFPEDAPTAEGAPAFPEYKPEATQHAKGGRPDAPPRFDDTDPGQAGPLEKGWEAPPGEAPRKRVNERGERSVVRPPKVKLIEDFSVIEPAPELSSVSVASTRSARRPREAPREPALARDTAPGRPQLPEASGANGSRAQLSESSGVSASQPRPLRTEERKMIAAVKRNQQFLLVVSGLALLGALCFGAAIWQLHQRRNHPFHVDLRQPAIPQAVVTPPVAVRPPAPEVHTAPPPPKKVPPPIQWDDPPSKRYAGYLTVKSNVPAYVYIDGARVRSHTPLVRYRVRPGRREIVLEAISTGDRKAFKVAIARGKVRAVYSMDLQGAPR